MSNRATEASGKTSAVGGEFFKGTAAYMDDALGAKILTEFTPNQYARGAGIIKDTSRLSDYFKNLPPLPSTMDPTGNGGNVISTNTVNSGNVYNSAGFAINSAGANDPRNMFGTQAHNAAGLF